LGLPGVKPALLGRPELADPRLLGGQPRPERALTLPEGVSADRSDQRAADHPEPGQQDAEHADEAERERRQAERDDDAEDRLQWPVEQALLAALGRRPLGVEAFGLRWRGTARRRARLG